MILFYTNTEFLLVLNHFVLQVDLEFAVNTQFLVFLKSLTMYLNKHPYCLTLQHLKLSVSLTLPCCENHNLKHM